MEARAWTVTTSPSDVFAFSGQASSSNTFVGRFAAYPVCKGRAHLRDGDAKLVLLFPFSFYHQHPLRIVLALHSFFWCGFLRYPFLSVLIVAFRCQCEEFVLAMKRMQSKHLECRERGLLGRAFADWRQYFEDCRGEQRLSHPVPHVVSTCIPSVEGSRHLSMSIRCLRMTLYFVSFVIDYFFPSLLTKALQM